MPPIDSTPDMKTGNFELLYSLNAYSRVPVLEFKSQQTGLTVVIAQVEGPVVNGFFCLVTEAFDDDGLPHTLEHLIFLGSEQFPYKGVLDLLANRCLASGTNAWTDTDHTCYTMETAGSEGFLTLMPIFLDHVLYPILSDEGFTTEVHHITREGEDAGVVYCEMQGRENSAESRLYLSMARAVYPGRCGYSSETGGIMKNLRESCNNCKVRNFHKEFYRPENLKIIITGQVKPEEVFKALAPFEEKVIAKGERGSFTRPWQSAVPPVLESKDLLIKYPSDDEKNGIYSMAWRGPSAVTDQYTLNSTTILLKYLTDFSVSPLQKEFVEIPDPYSSKVVYSITENSIACLCLIFENVPREKLPQIKKKLLEVLGKIVDTNDIDMERMKNTINRHKLESLSNMENDPHHAVASMIIGHMLYGNTKEDLEQRINPLVDLEKIAKESKSYWVNLLKKYLLDGNFVSIEGYPSTEEQQRMAAEEKERIEAQIKLLGEEGIRQKEEELEKALEFNERPPPDSMLTSVTIPSLNSINFHNIVRYHTESDQRSNQIDQIDISGSSVYSYFDHVKSGFVYMFALMDTSELTSEQRLYLPLLLEALFESPIKKGDKIISYEDVVTELNNDTVSIGGQIGLNSSRGDRFKCGLYSHTASVMLQVESAKYDKGVTWLRDLLCHTLFTTERLTIIATKIVNDVSQAKRSGRNVVAYVMKGLCYIQDSNPQANGILKQHKFLSNLLEKLNSEKSSEVIGTIEEIRGIITKPSNLALYFAGNLDQLKSPATAINNFLPAELKTNDKIHSLSVTPDWKLLHPINEGMSSCIVGMGCLESSFFFQTTPSIKSYLDPDVPALLVYIQYLIQAEGPMWKQIRGKGLSYGYTISWKANEGLLYLVFSKATNVVAAYKEAYDIVSKQISDKIWDNTLIESAKSSLIFEIIEEEKTIGNVVSLSLSSYFQGVDYKYNRNLLNLIEKVTTDDLNKIGDTYMEPLFDPTKTKTAVVCDPSKAEEIKQGFQKLHLELKVYASLEDSFLNY